MANANEIVLDTYVSPLTFYGFEAKYVDKDNDPFTLLTNSGGLTVSGRKVFIPSITYTYPSNSDVYEDVVLNLNTSLIGDGVKSTFTIALNSQIKPILFSTLRVIDGRQLLSDISTDLLNPETNAAATEAYSGTGILKGDGTGTINYSTGELTFTFSAPPPSGAPIEISWVTINRIPVSTNDVPPNKVLNSTRLRVIRTSATEASLPEILAVTDWDKPVFLTGRIFQAREANEIVSILIDKIASIGGTIFVNGDYIGGSQLTVGEEYLTEDGDTRRDINITTGLYYMEGCVRSVPGATVQITGSGIETVGIRVIRSLITEDLNGDLKDISTGWDGSGFPGAYREHLELQWKANDTDAFTVYKFVNGSPINVPTDTNFSKINNILAHRTYLESGNYKVNGFKPAFTEIVYPTAGANETGTIAEGQLTDDLALWLTFDSGTAFVEGYEVFKPQSSKVRWLKARGVKSKEGVTFTYKPSPSPDREIYPLDNLPVASVSRVKGYARTPLMQINAPVAGETQDIVEYSFVDGTPTVRGTKFTGISQNSAISNVKIFSTDTATDDDPSEYVQGDDAGEGDFHINQNQIHWHNSVSPIPAVYYAIWTYDTSAGDFPLIKGTRILKKEVLSLTMTSDQYQPIKRIAFDLRQDENSPVMKDLAKYFRVYTDETGTPANTEFTFGVDYKIKLGRSETSTDIAARLIWKRKGRRPGAEGEDVPYFVEVYRWTHDIALHDAPAWLANQSAAGCAEGDYVSADSYLEELPDLPENYLGSQIQFPNAPSGEPYNSKRYRVIYQVPGFRNSSVAGEKDTKNRNSIDFRPLGVLIGEGTRRSLAPESTVTCDYYYFQPRLDSVRLDRDGFFQIVYGENGSQTYPVEQSDKTLPLIQIYSKANTRYPKLTDTSIYRSTMQDIQILKERVNRLEVDFVTTSLEQDAIASAGSQLLRGVFTDPFRNFDFVDLDYKNVPAPETPSAVDTWQNDTQYYFNDVVKVTGIVTVYFRCIRTGRSRSSGSPTWNASPGSITDEILNDTSVPLWKAFGYNKFPMQYSNDLSKIADTPIYPDSSVNNLAGALKFQSHVETIRDGLIWPVQYDPEWSSNVFRSNQLLMLPFRAVTRGAQSKSNYFIQINPRKVFKPVMTVDITPPADCDVDLTLTPIISTTLPGSSVDNKSGQYGTDAGAAEDIGDTDYPVHEVPTPNPYGKLDGWAGQFHLGIPTDTVSINSSVAPGVMAPLAGDGSANSKLGYGIPKDLLGAGFLPDMSYLTSSTQFENIGDITVSNALTRYIKKRNLMVSAAGVPPAADVSVYFNGRQVNWILSDGSRVPTIKSLSDAVRYGTVNGTIQVPENTPAGKHEISIQANGYTGRATYVAQGHMGQSSTNWTSALTTVNDLREEVTPLAQGFRVGSDGYISGVVLYFSNVDANLGLEVQIRNVVNGVPGRTVLGKAFRRLGAEEVNGLVYHSTNATRPVFVNFVDPVYVEQNKEYAICLVTESSNYRIWAATFGGKALEDGSVIARHPEVGSLYISENGLNWTSTRETALKFDLIHCDFTKQSAIINFPEVDTITGSSFILSATSLLPTNSKINWSASVEGSKYFPIRPNMLVNIEKVWRSIKLRAEIIAGVNTDGMLISPCINCRHMNLFTHTYVGSWYGYTNVGASVVESNYIGENVELNYTIEQLKVFTEEYFKSPQRVEVYFSSDNGDTWIPFANASNEVDITNTSYAATDMGGASKMYDVARSLTINPATVSGDMDLSNAVPVSATATGGTLTPGTRYYLKYTFMTATGESTPCATEANVLISGGNNAITFDIPTDSSDFPENDGYNGGKTVRINDVNVYMGTETGVLIRLSETATQFIRVPEEDKITVNILSIDEFEDDTLLNPPTVNTTQPVQFKVRIRLIAPLEEHLVENPVGEETALGASPSVVSVEEDSGLTPAGTYYLRYSWTTEFGETKPSYPASVTVDSSNSSIYFKFSETDANINLPSMTFPPGARGARLYSSALPNVTDYTQYSTVFIEVKRDGVLKVVDEILLTDEYVSNEGFRIINPKWWSDEETIPSSRLPSQYNSTGGLVKSAPQVAKLRVIAVDEV